MSLFKDLISQIDQPASGTFSAPSPVQRLASGSPKPVSKPASRTATPPNAAPESQVLKRKASSTIESAQTKTLRKDAPAPPRQPNGTARNPPASGPVNPSLSVSVTSMPYRGTAGLGASRPTTPLAKKPSPQISTVTTASKAAAPAPKPAAPKPGVASPNATTTAPVKKTGGYMAMLMKAKEKDLTKPVAPPIKHETTKILTKKERLQAKLAAKGKKPAAGPLPKTTNAKPEATKDARKPAAVGYQGTARPTAPAKKAVEIGYKGTARPAAGSGPAGRVGAAAAKRKPDRNQYGRWSASEDELEDDEEDDGYGYESESDDMEGGIWDVEKEEQEALKLAKREDAAALAEENALKRAKEERRRKLAALSKTAAGKKKSQY